MSDEVTDFERDAISFILELAQKCGVKPQEAFPRLAGMRHRLSELRTKWVEEIDTLLVHVQREREANHDRVVAQAKAIDLALIALEPVRNSVGSADAAIRILERAIERNGSETPGEAP